MKTIENYGRICWSAATQGMVYLNGTWQIGISGGFQNGRGYIGTVTYLIN